MSMSTGNTKNKPMIYIYTARKKIHTKIVNSNAHQRNLRAGIYVPLHVSLCVSLSSLSVNPFV